MHRMELHSHTHYSNLRLLDCINRPKDLIERAIELDLAGIAITDHESLSAHVELDKLIKEYKKTNPDFKIARGNEIYLVDERISNQKYYHFILVAKDAIGHKMLRELSSNSWINSYYDRGMERVPTLKSELSNLIFKYGKGHLIASSACLGSELDYNILEMNKAEIIGDKELRKQYHSNIVKHMKYCIDLFGEDFYCEVQPSQREEQMIVNTRMKKIADCFNVKIIVTTDAHYLKKEDRYIHEAYLNSKEGDREVAEFYSDAYLQTTEEVINNLQGTGLDYYELEKNTLEIYNKLEDYSLEHTQSVPEVPVKDYPKKVLDCDMSKYPTLEYLLQSDNEQERYWVNQCLDKLVTLNISDKQYYERLEYEADIKKAVGDNLNTCVFAYPIFLQHYIDLFWECGSPVGAGRGSAGAGLNHYLLGITQTDPIKTNSPFWRYMNKERVEMPDIDIDLAPSKRELIFEKIREERGQLGCVQVCTFSTESTKSAIQTACRGYRSREYPIGIDVDTAQYLSSLVPSERGFLWPIHDVVYGNEDKGRKPEKLFINEIEKYPGLLDIIINIEGLIKNRSIHASGVNFYGEDPYSSACFMKATNGSIITQYSLHDAEYCGDVKLDFLVTEQMDIMGQCIQILQEHGYIEEELTLREAYDEYVHPDKLPLEDDKLWDAICSTDVLALFQLNTSVGGNIVRQLQPRNVEELTACNALMRLSGEDGAERPADRYERFKNDISQWYSEMNEWGLTKEEQKVLEKYMLVDYGAPSSQEVLMTILMDKDTCNFSLAESNAARKVIAKKQIDKVDELKNKIISRAKRKVIGEYIWKNVIMPQASYSFSRIHGYSYSLIGCQAAYLATYFPSVCWNTAYLRVISGLEDEASSNYDKIAKGIGDIISHGVKVSLVDINKSGYMFEPDIENNEILYGMKGISGVNGDVIRDIIDKRPYLSFEDFVETTKFNKTVMISLIKSGAFDQFEERKTIMKKYIWSVCNPKKRLTMQNFNGLIEKKIIPQELDYQRRLFNFNKALRKKYKIGNELKLEGRFYDFYSKHFSLDNLYPKDDSLYINEKVWKKLYDTNMMPAKVWLKNNEKDILDKFNNILFEDEWNKYAQGSYSYWEIETLGFYYHNHELSNVNDSLYDIVEFDTLSDEPVVDYTFKRNGREIPIFKTNRIAGVAIAKDDVHTSVSILTKESGVVNVKLNRELYAMYNRRISEVQLDGTKKIVENGWFQRGKLLVFNGIRRGNTFMTKKYKKTPYHQVYKITEVMNNGALKMTHLRYGQTEE